MDTSLPIVRKSYWFASATLTPLQGVKNNVALGNVTMHVQRDANTDSMTWGFEAELSRQGAKPGAAYIFQAGDYSGFCKAGTESDKAVIGVGDGQIEGYRWEDSERRRPLL